jgi:AcrR family transcriptional regulator
MVQKSAAKRGRPRGYDPDTALGQAMTTFWTAGFAATSLDDLGAAMGMNRPSLYGAFGDKHALYLAAIERYRAMARAALQTALDNDLPLREALNRVYQSALSWYLPSGQRPRGCFLIGTAVTESVNDPAVRGALAAGLREIDEALEARIRRAQPHGGADPSALAKLAAAALYSIAIQARAGVPRPALEAIARAALDVIAPAPKPTRRR